MKTAKQLHVKPLYHVNLTLSRKVGVYRCTFLIGGCLAPDRLVLKENPGATPDSLGVLRFYHNSAEVAARAAARWILKNKEAV